MVQVRSKQRGVGVCWAEGHQPPPLSLWRIGFEGAFLTPELLERLIAVNTPSCDVVQNLAFALI